MRCERIVIWGNCSNSHSDGTIKEKTTESLQLRVVKVVKVVMGGQSMMRRDAVCFCIFTVDAVSDIAGLLIDTRS